ncbi:MFS transporter [Gammaproteobacteria bacterium]|nr:MFS transporter [Gammaproteobacteria bacterium]
MQENTWAISNQIERLKPWIVCLSAGLFFFYDFIQLNAFNTLNPYISEAFGMSALQVGYLSSTYLIATVCMLPFSGALLDRFPTRDVILTAMAACIFSTLVFAVAPNVWIAAIARFMCGASTAFCFLSCLVLSTKWFRSQQLAMVTGVIVTMAMFGGMISQEPMAHLINAYGWRNALLADAGFGVLLFAIMYGLIENQPVDYVSVEKVDEPFMKSYKKALDNPQNIICGGYTALMNLFIFIFGAVWGIEYLQNVYNLSFVDASRISMMLFFGTMIGSPLAGKLSDVMGKRRLPMILGASISLLLSLILFSTSLSQLQLTLLFFMLGLTTSTQIISYPVIFERNHPSITGTCEAIAGVIIMSAGAIFQPLFGLMMDHHALTIMGSKVYQTQDYQFAYYILPVCLLVSLILALNVKETNCEPIWQNKNQ